MPQFYTLEEAARVLGISSAELETLVRSNKVRALRDGGSLRFRQADIDEEARRRGMGSDPELPLSDLDLESPLDLGSDDKFDLSEFQLGVAPPDLAPPSLNLPTMESGSDHEILLDERSLPPQSATGSSSTIIGMHPGKGKLPSDSDVRLVPDMPNKSASDSDVRLGSRTPSDSDVTLVADEAGSSREIASFKPEDDPNATMLQPSPMLGSSDDLPHLDGTSDSDFELTPSSVIDALEPESGSDFELTALDQSDEFESTPMRGLSDSDVTGAMPASSGVNLSRPSDSGINLQSVGGFDMASADSIELAPIDDEDAPPTGAKKPQPPAGGKAKPAKAPAARQEEKVDLSATALPMRADKDIFEDTDFDVDVDAIDSSDEDRTVQLDAQSDFDVEEGSGDSASEVFAVDEDDVDANAATAMGPAVLDDDGNLDEGESDDVDSAWDVEEVATPSQAASRVMTPSLVSTGGAGPDWGGLWVGMLSVATLFMMLLAFVGMDLVRNLYYFQGDTPASGLVQQLAGLIGG